MTTDRFGNPLDPSVGYARGQILRSSADEVRRLRHAQSVAATLVAERGAGAIGIFTGNPRRFPLLPEDLDTWSEEWVGPGMFAEELRNAGIEHLGGQPDHAVAVVNRTSGGIVAAMLALSAGRPVVSLAPVGDRSHASVVRGCRLGNVELVEVDDPDLLAATISQHHPALVVVTTVTSSLGRLDDAVTAGAIGVAQVQGAVVFMDEAYGARLRPVLHGGAKSLSFGADVAITNTDKAGLSGPRAGVIVGREDVVVSILAKASELGIEARAPIAAGALRSLQSYDPQLLRAEAADGSAIADVLVELLGDAAVKRSDLGPAVSEEDVYELVQARAQGNASSTLVPCEVTAAVGMLMLRGHGVLTVNTHGQPGGRVSLRLKPTAGAIDAVGGVKSLGAALDAKLSEVAQHLSDPGWIEALLFGEQL